jgi:hypothetical protein
VRLFNRFRGGRRRSPSRAGTIFNMLQTLQQLRLVVELGAGPAWRGGGGGRRRRWRGPWGRCVGVGVGWRAGVGMWCGGPEAGKQNRGTRTRTPGYNVTVPEIFRKFIPIQWTASCY